MQWDRGGLVNWKEISVLTEGKCVEAIAGIFHRMGSGGVKIEDPQAARQYVNRGEWNADLFPPEFLGHEFVVVKAYFHEDREVIDEIMASLKLVEENFNTACRVFIDEVRDEDWEQNWKKYYHSFKVGDRLVIKPSWEDYQAQDGKVIIEIDPGMAFGTGIHASTRFCLHFIDQYIKGGETVVDAGCGSGILSIAAAKLGARSVFSMDIDDVAVKIARDNVALNNLSDVIEVQAGDIVEELKQKAPDIIMANITAEVVIMLLPIAASVLKPGGYLFGSGIVESRWPAVQKRLESNGFIIEQVQQDVDWIGVVARKPSM